MRTKAGGLTRETVRQGKPRSGGAHSSSQDADETDKRDVPARDCQWTLRREVGREGVMRHKQGQICYASTPPLEALKVVLVGELPQASVKGKSWYLLMYGERTSTLSSTRRRVFVEMPPEDYQEGCERH